MFHLDPWLSRPPITMMLNLAARRFPQLARCSRPLVTLKDHKYTAAAVAKSDDLTVSSNGLDLKLALPTELGGSGGGENPEQLLAMGYASCLLLSIEMMAKKMGRKDPIKNAVVTAKVHLGKTVEMPGLGFELDVEVEGVDEELLKAGREVCPYTRALKHGIVVNVSKV
ncbi:OsmC-like protein [Mycena floridula]|nr:OsmC-like protein [Mycena floridula]